jgi:hypothetical protein
MAKVYALLVPGNEWRPHGPLGVARSLEEAQGWWRTQLDDIDRETWAWNNTSGERKHTEDEP